MLQFKVTTPDGIYCIANACQNQDLFWALRGGGGSTFGVVLEATTKAEGKMAFQSIGAGFNPLPEHMSTFFSAVIDNSLKWANEGWGGYITPGSLFYANPNMTVEAAAPSMKPLTDLMASFGNDALRNSLQTYSSFLPLFGRILATSSAPAGLPITVGSRIIPAANFHTPESRSALLTATLNALAATSGSFEILVTAPYLYKGAVNQTSVTPAWRSALWHAAFFVAWGFDTTAPADIKPYYDAADTAADFMRAIAPNSGAYQNEAQVHEPNHEESFWGSNYSRLATLKMKYDPSGLLDCWHCIGWKGPNDARYKCYV